MRAIGTLWLMCALDSCLGHMVDDSRQLLVGFFRYYSSDFFYRDDVASIRAGRIMTKVAV